MRQDEQKKTPVLAVRIFAGLLTSASAFALPGQYAQVQQNMTTTVPGQLTVRKGHAAAIFENAITSTTDEVIAMYTYPRPEATLVVYELSDGLVKAGRNPT